MPAADVTVSAEFAPETMSWSLEAAHTGGTKWGNDSTTEVGVDLPKQGICSQTKYQTGAYVQIDGLSAASDVAEAKLVTDIIQPNGGDTARTMDIYYLANETDITTLTKEADYAGNKGEKIDTQQLKRAHGNNSTDEIHEITFNVTEAVRTAIAAGKDTAIFYITGNAGGGFLVGNGYTNLASLALENSLGPDSPVKEDGIHKPKLEVKKGRAVTFTTTVTDKDFDVVIKKSENTVATVKVTGGTGTVYLVPDTYTYELAEQNDYLAVTAQQLVVDKTAQTVALDLKPIPYYAITVEEATGQEGWGSVTVAVENSDKTNEAREGAKVTLTSNPEAGWSLSLKVVKAAGGDAVPFTEGTTFTMPGEAVKVQVTATNVASNPQATLKIVKTTDGKDTGKIGEPIEYDKGTTHYKDEQITVNSSWFADFRSEVDGDKKTFHLYTYQEAKDKDGAPVSGDKYTLKEGENVIYVTFEDSGELYYYEDFDGDVAAYKTSSEGNNDRNYWGVTRNEAKNNFWMTKGKSGAGRTATLTFNNMPESIPGKYTLEMDLYLRDGGGESQFAILTGAAASNSWTASNYLLSLGITGAGNTDTSAAWKLNLDSNSGSSDTTITFNQPSGGAWGATKGETEDIADSDYQKDMPDDYKVHLTLTVDPADKASGATLVIGQQGGSGGNVYEGVTKATINGDSTVPTGVVMLGKQYQEVGIDNVVIKPAAE